MSVAVNVADLRAAVRAVVAGIERRNDIQILGCVQVKSDADGIAVTANDMDNKITTRAPAQTGGALDVAVPGSRLARVLAALDTETITLTAKGKDLEFASGDATGILYGLPVDDVPVMSASFPASRTLSMPAAGLRAVLANTLIAVSTEKTRYYLNGIYLHGRFMASGALALSGVATDGHKLSQQDTTLPEGAHGAFHPSVLGCILPRKSAGLLLRLIGPSPVGDIEVSVDQVRAKARFRLADGTELISKFIDGVYPDYYRVIPREFTGNAKIGRRELLSALRFVTSVCHGNSSTVLMRFDGTRLGVMTKNEEGGHAYTAIPTVASKPIEIGVNAKHLCVLLAVMDAEVVVVRYSDASGPILLQGDGNDTLRQVIMPVRI
jgi:DNA polymerase III subunit beta